MNKKQPGIITTINKWKEFNDEIKRDNEIFERAMNDERWQQIDRFLNIGNFKEALNYANSIISDVKKLIINLDYNDFKYLKGKNKCEFYYNLTIQALLIKLQEFSQNVSDKIEERGENINEYEKIYDIIYGNGDYNHYDVFLEISIDKNNFNKIDIVNGLPIFLTGLGIGKKVYKKLIKDFKYMSSFINKKNEASLNSDLTWLSIIKDEEIYSFTYEDNIISIFHTMEYDEIINLLKEFYKNVSQTDNIQFDDTFLKQYKLTDKKLKEILWN